MMHSKVTIFNLYKQSDLEEFNALKNVTKIDHFVEQVEELFTIVFPEYKEDTHRKSVFVQEYTSKLSEDYLDVWVYYPWRQSVVHVLCESDFHRVRTARNFPLISIQEQQKLLDLTIGIVGLSVGSSVAQTLAYSGIGKHFKLADADTLELSNMNRIKSSVFDLGENKTIVAARTIWEANPFAQIEIFPAGLNSENLKEFFYGSSDLEILFDECDDMQLKFYLRLAARSLRITLMMASDIGFTTNISVLEFDKNPTAGMEHIPEVSFEDVLYGYSLAERLELDDSAKILLINELIGEKNISDEMKNALVMKSQGKLASFPQLGAIAFMGGGLSALAVIAKIKQIGEMNQKIEFKILDHLIRYSVENLEERKLWNKKYTELITALQF